jgi:uncharacterized protein
LIAYPDTSVLVAAFVEEAASRRADAWLTDNVANLVVSGWLDVEFASALAAKERARFITGQQLASVLAVYQQQVRPAAGQLSVTERAFARAGSMIGMAQGLRAGDALHLAIAEEHDALFVTLDRQQAKLGAGLGVKIRLI